MKLPVHRISLEERSGIWLMFYETLTSFKGFYKQELLRIFGHRIRTELRFEAAKLAALCLIADRKITAPLIVRDDSKKNVTVRGE